MEIFSFSHSFSGVCVLSKMAFSQGLVSGTDIPVEHLDYDYIGKCNKPSEVESLLKILR